MPERCERCGLEPLILDTEGCCAACRACLIPQAYLEDVLGHSYRLAPAGITIGRKQVEHDAQAVTVSRRHVRIAFDSERNAWFLIRVSSANNMVNGAEGPMLGRLQLIDCAEIALGAVTLTFNVRGG